MLQHVSVYINHNHRALSLYFANVTMLTSVTYISLFEVIGIVSAYAATIPITSDNDMYENIHTEKDHTMHDFIVLCLKAIMRTCLPKQRIG